MAVAVAAAATGGAAAGVASGLGASATVASVVAGAAGGVAAQGATDLIEVYGTQTKKAEDVSLTDYAVAAVTGGALGGIAGAAAANPSAVRFNLNPNIRGLGGLDGTVVQRGAQFVQRSLTAVSEASFNAGARAVTIVESVVGADVVATPWGTRSRTTGQFVSSQRKGIDPVDDFIAHAEKKNNFRALGREIKVRTPFGERRLDVALQNRETLEIGGVELKSSAREFARLRTEQFAGDRWINRYGAPTFGKRASQAGVKRIDSVVKILWQSPRALVEAGLFGLAPTLADEDERERR